MGWTEERKELVRRRWIEGLSASQIAAEIGDVSRNAVVGVIHREGWQRGTFVKVWTSERLAELKKWDLAGYKIQNDANEMGLTERQIRDGLEKIRHQVSERRARVYRPRTPRVLPLIRRDAKPVRPNTPLVGARPVSFLQLTARTCRWPLGGYDDPAEFFCGAEASGSYCSHHQDVSCGRTPSGQFQRAEVA